MTDVFFNRGSEAAEALAESTRGTRFPRTHYLGTSLAKKGDTVVVRFLTEADGPTGWISVLMHVMANTRPAPQGHTGKWPEKMDAVCRKDPQMVKAFGFDGCYICENYKDNYKKDQPAKGSPRTWALCVVRKDVVAGGMRVGFEDAMREEIEIGPDGKAVIDQATGKAKVVMVPDVRVVTYGYDPFFKILKNHSAAYGGTLLDRDYFIQRGERKVGSNIAADYALTPMDKVHMKPGDPTSPAWDLRPAGLAAIGEAMGIPGLTLEMLYPNIPSIPDLLVERVKDEYYDRFFDIRHPQPVRKTDSEGDVHGPAEGPSGAEVAAGVPAQPDVSGDAMEAMRARLAAAQPTPYPSAPSA